MSDEVSIALSLRKTPMRASRVEWLCPCGGELKAIVAPSNWLNVVDVTPLHRCESCGLTAWAPDGGSYPTVKLNPAPPRERRVDLLAAYIHERQEPPPPAARDALKNEMQRSRHEAERFIDLYDRLRQIDLDDAAGE
jgi:hypothetical protein